MSKTQLPKRAFPAHPPPVERFDRPTVLFVTASLRDRTLRLDTSRTHRELLGAWTEADAWRVGWYMIMPDHVHLFCVPGSLPPVSVKMWSKYWKGQFRRRLALDRSVWLRDCWDTQMRDYDHYVEKRAYVARNPVRKELVESEQDWPYQGEIHTIVW